MDGSQTSLVDNDNSLDCMHTVPVQKSDGSLVTNRDNRLSSVALRRDGVAGTG